MKTLFVMVGIPGAGQLNTVSELARILKEVPENTVSVFTKNIDVPRRYYDCNTGSMAILTLWPFRAQSPTSPN